jgi:FdhD protein
MAEEDAAVALPIRRLDLIGAGGQTEFRASVAVETPVNIVYGTLPYAVMMASPADLEDFVAGFSLTEGVIGEAGDIRGMTVRREAGGLVAEVELTPDRLRAHLALSRRRNLTGRTSCGLCGIDNLNELPLALRQVRQGAKITATAIAAALAGLSAGQSLFRLTRSAHAAAWCDLDGRIVALREDVGRHNALDKLIGARLRAGCSRDGFVLVTSRASFEMVEKTAIFGAPGLVAISAPTSLAVERAKALGLTLVALARSDAALVFAGEIVDQP